MPISKVWIEPGCIVCDLCEGHAAEVFRLTETACEIRPGAPLDGRLDEKIRIAAQECPVEVIRYE